MKCLLALLLVSSVAASGWHESEGGLIKWDTDCWWSMHISDAIASKAAAPEECGGFCILTSGCKAFDWGDGVCYAYSRTSTVVDKAGWMCGYREF